MPDERRNNAGVGVSSRRTMKEFGPQDVNQLLHKCFALYLRVRNPSSSLQRLMKFALAVVNAVHGEHASSPDMVGQCVSMLSRLQELLQEGTCTKGLLFFRRRSQKCCDREVDEIWEQAQSIRGEVHARSTGIQTHLPIIGGGVSKLISLLSEGQGEAKEAAMKKLAVLSGDRWTSREIAKKGGIPVLINLLDDDATSKCQPYAARTLANLALSERDVIDSILEHGGLEKFCLLLFSSDKTLQEQVARCIGNITDSFEGTITKPWSQAIIGLINMLRSTAWSKVQAVRAVTGLVKHQALRNELVSNGAVKPLLKLSMMGCRVTSHLAVRAVAFLSIDEEHSIVLADEGAVQVFLTILEEESLAVKFKENLLCTLANIAALDRSSGTRSKIWEKGIWLLVRGCTEQSAVCRRNSVLALAHLSRRKSLQSVMTKLDAVPWLVELMLSEDLPSRQRATITLANITSSRKCAAAHMQLIEAGGAAVLVDMLDASDDLCREQACRTLARLSLRRQFHGQILTSGAVPSLLGLLRKHTTPTCVGFAVCTLAALSRTANGLDEIRRCGGSRIVAQLGCASMVCKRNRAIILTRLKDRPTSG